MNRRSHRSSSAQSVWIAAAAIHVWLAAAPLPPQQLLCPYTAAAWAFARRIQPRCGREVYDALIDSNCSDRPGFTPPPEKEEKLPTLHSLLRGGAVVVSPAGGSDVHGDGTVERPFETLEYGVQIVCSAEHTAARKDKRVVLRAGTYHLGGLGAPLLLGPIASGIELVAAPGEDAVVTGGVEIKPNWHRWHSSLRSTAVLVTDIPAQMLPRGIAISELLTVDGRRMVTAREPDANPYDYATWQGGIRAASHWGIMQYNSTAGANETTVVVEKAGLPWDRNVSCGDTHFKGAFGGSLGAFADSRGCGWAGHVPVVRQKGLSWSCPPSDRWCHSPWKNASEASVWCTGLWSNLGFEVGLAEWRAMDKTSSHNETSTVNLTFSRGGQQMAFGPLWPGICNNFFIEGVVEALSAPGEFYHDRAAGRLYMIPYNTSAPPPDVLVAVTSPTLLRFKGNQDRPVHDITITGITFRGASKTFLGPHVSTTNGADWAVPRSAAVEFEGVQRVVVTNCTFDTLGGSAVLWSGYVRNAQILSSEFRWLGGNGVLAIGDDDWGNATSGDYPVNNTVDQCMFHEIGVYAKHSAAYAEFVAGAANITRNIIFNVARAGVALNDAMGGGNLLSRNLIFATVRESTDHPVMSIGSGPINSWNRQAYLTLDPRTGAARTSVNEVADNEIRQNFIIAGTGTSTYPIDHDDCSANYHDHHNVLLFGPAKQWGGHSKRATDNLQIWPDYGTGEYGRAACYDYQATGAYNEVFANNTCILSGHRETPWCNRTGCGVMTFRDVCPSDSGNLDVGTFGLIAANNTYYTPAGVASWRSSDQGCALPLHDVQQRKEEAGSCALNVSQLSTSMVLAHIKELLW